MKSVLVLCVCLTMVAAPVSAADIAWVSFHGADDTGNTPSAPAAGVGFTVAPDKGYTDLLIGAGHAINRITVPATGANAAIPAAMLAELNAANLVIIGRSVNSGSFQEAAETMSWNADVTVPMIITSGFITRANRLGYNTGDDVDDIGGPTRFVAADPFHPIFDGITLNASNETDTILDLVTVPVNGTPTVQRGTSINTDPLVAGATLIASITGDNSNMELQNQPVIAEFPSGTAGANTGEVFASRRLTFITGSRESEDPTVGDIAGILDLSADGQQMFLNAVEYMLVPPVPIIPGDTDGDQVVEFEDFEPIRANFRKTVTQRSQGDLVRDNLVRDNVVDFKDFRQWKGAFLGGGGSLEGLDLSFATNVPEPGSAALVLTAALGVVCARRKRA
jgi:hypothetical protein